jgi:hypothetical protein
MFDVRDVERYGLITTVNRLYNVSAMTCPLVTFAVVAMMAGQSYAQAPTGTIIIYRERGKNFGLIHYSEGVHPTIYCDNIKVVKMAESRSMLISANAGVHTCVALEKQYPGELNADSDKVSIEVKRNRTTYLRLHCPFGHVHFVLEEVSEETGSAEAAKMHPAKRGDFYTTVLPAITDNKSSQ